MRPNCNISKLEHFPDVWPDPEQQTTHLCHPFQRSYAADSHNFPFSYIWRATKDDTYPQIFLAADISHKTSINATRIFLPSWYSYVRYVIPSHRDFNLSIIGAK